MAYTFNVYRREKGDPNPPVAIVAGLTSKNFADDTVVKGTTYMYSIGATDGTTEKVSSEIEVLAKVNYVKFFYTSGDIFVFGDSEQLVANETTGGLTIGSLSANKSNVFQLTDSPTVLDFTAEFEITRLVGSDAEASVGLMFRTSNWTTNGIGSAGLLVAFSAARIIFTKGTNSHPGTEHEIASVWMTFALNRKYSIKIEMVSSTLKVYVDSSLVATETMSVNTAGSFGFRSWSSYNGVSSKIENLRITDN